MSLSQIATENINSFLENSDRANEAISISIDNHCSQKLVSLQVSPNASIYELKQLIQEEEGMVKIICSNHYINLKGVSPEHVILHFNKEELHNDRKLADYGIQADDLLISHYDLSGGKLVVF